MARTRTKTPDVIDVRATKDTRIAKVEAAQLPATPMEMLNKAVSQGASGDVLERLLGLQERWEANQAKKAFEAALAALRPDLPELTKASTVDFTTDKGRTHYRYEDLGTVINALAGPLGKHGLSFRWRTSQPTPDSVTVTCILSHEAGHSEETTLTAGIDKSGNKNPIQALGSGVTYLQRYTLKAAVGVAASVDTDSMDIKREGPKREGPKPVKTEATHADSTAPITEKQIARLWALNTTAGRTKQEAVDYLKRIGYKASGDIPRDAYEMICTTISHPGALPNSNAIRVPGEDDGD